MDKFFNDRCECSRFVNGTLVMPHERSSLCPKNKEMITNTRKTLVQLIRSTNRLHKRFNIPDATFSDMSTRLRLQVEEVGEVAKALNHGNEEELMSEVVDVAVVAIGTLLLLGDKVNQSIEKVIEKNDKKTLETHIFKDGKIVKK